MFSLQSALTAHRMPVQSKHCMWCKKFDSDYLKDLKQAKGVCRAGTAKRPAELIAEVKLVLTQRSAGGLIWLAISSMHSRALSVNLGSLRHLRRQVCAHYDRACLDCAGTGCPASILSSSIRSTSDHGKQNRSRCKNCPWNQPSGT